MSKPRELSGVAAPEMGVELAPHHRNDDMMRALLLRRSTTAKNLGEPGPDEAQTDILLRAAMRVPDHSRRTPWRFVTFRGETRAAFGQVLGKAMAAREPECPDDRLAFERDRFMRAPVVIAVVSCVLENDKIPVWEQQLSAGAACQNMLLAASALGFAAQWITEWYAYDPIVRDALGLRSGERVAGFIYVGAASEAPSERWRPNPKDYVREWSPKLSV